MKQKGWLKKHGVTLLIVALLIVGICIMLYPTVANFWNGLHQSRAIATYVENVSSIEPDEYNEFIAKAREYNKKLAASGLKWNLSEEEKAEYDAQLNMMKTGIMGYIRIEKLNQMIPVYHGTTESVLQTSVGHLEGTSLPVGCESFNRRTGELDDPTECNHIVVSGHRGLPSVKLFSDLDKLEEGDIFSFTILSETYTYEVDQIRIVLPEDLSSITLVPGKDYCTLVTCTPYGINTHRLLVRGHRVNNINDDIYGMAGVSSRIRVPADALQIEKRYIVPFLMIPILAILVAFLIIVTAQKKKRRLILEEAEQKLNSNK
ncbi:MAG: class C sortase [Lachnospiraceae bacterium]|nr:class C sortase [Lachnospiraceae bacterium]